MVIQLLFLDSQQILDFVFNFPILLTGKTRILIKIKPKTEAFK